VKKQKTGKCRWCGRMVPLTKKGWLNQHHNLPKHKHCLGCGQRPAPNATAQAGAATSLKPVVGNSRISKKSLDILAADDYEEYGDDPV